MKTLRILKLRWQLYWCQIALEIDEAQIALHLPSLERNRKRLAHLEFKLDQAYAPQSLIMQAINRANGKA